MINICEKLYEKKYLDKVLHTTLNPDEPGVVRIHLVPSKFSWFKVRPSTVILNGKDIVPLNLSWTIVLSVFINEVNVYKGNEISDEDLNAKIKNTDNNIIISEIISFKL